MCREKEDNTLVVRLIDLTTARIKTKTKRRRGEKKKKNHKL